MELSAKILIVDDEPDIRDLIKIVFERRGCTVIEASNGFEAVASSAINKDIDLVIMDIMMPGMDGVEACAKIREKVNVPVLFLTAKTQEPDKEQAYHSGGDDFLIKPFSQNELVRKAFSLIRRYRVYDSEQRESDTLQIGNIIVDYDKRKVRKDGCDIKLTDKEYDLLLFLLKNRGTPWTVAQLYENVWNEKYYSSSSNTIMVHILRLRQKIEDDPSSPVIVRTVYGRGYQVD